MANIKKTVTIPEHLYKEVISEEENFSRAVQEALKAYLEGRRLRKKKTAKLMSLFGALKSWEISDGKEFVDRIRSETIRTQKKREEWLDI